MEVTVPLRARKYGYLIQLKQINNFRNKNKSSQRVFLATVYYAPTKTVFSVKNRAMTL